MKFQRFRVRPELWDFEWGRLLIRANEASGGFGIDIERRYVEFHIWKVRFGIYFRHSL